MTPPVASVLLDPPQDDVVFAPVDLHAVEFTNVKRFLDDQRRLGASYKEVASFVGSVDELPNVLDAAAKEIEPALKKLLAEHTDKNHFVVAIVPPGHQTQLINNADVFAFYEHNSAPQEVKSAQALRPSFNIASGELQAGGQLPADERFRIIVQMGKTIAASAVNQNLQVGADADPAQQPSDKITLAQLGLGLAEGMLNAPRRMGRRDYNNLTKLTLIEGGKSAAATKKLSPREQTEIRNVINALAATERDPVKKQALLKLEADIATGQITTLDVLRKTAGIKDQPALEKTLDTVDKTRAVETALDQTLERLRAKADSDPAFETALLRLTEAREALNAGGDVTTLLTIVSDLEKTGVIDVQLKQQVSQLDAMHVDIADTQTTAVLVKQQNDLTLEIIAAALDDVDLSALENGETSLEAVKAKLVKMQSGDFDTDALADVIDRLQDILPATVFTQTTQQLDVVNNNGISERLLDQLSDQPVSLQLQTDLIDALSEAGLSPAQFELKTDTPLTHSDAEQIIAALLKSDVTPAQMTTLDALHFKLVEETPLSPVAQGEFQALLTANGLDLADYKVNPAQPLLLGEAQQIITGLRQDEAAIPLPQLTDLQNKLDSVMIAPPSVQAAVQTVLHENNIVPTALDINTAAPLTVATVQEIVTQLQQIPDAAPAVQQLVQQLENVTVQGQSADADIAVLKEPSPTQLDALRDLPKNLPIDMATQKTNLQDLQGKPLVEPGHASAAVKQPVDVMEKLSRGEQLSGNDLADVVSKAAAGDTNAIKYLESISHVWALERNKQNARQNGPVITVNEQIAAHILPIKEVLSQPAPINISEQSGVASIPLPLSQSYNSVNDNQIQPTDYNPPVIQREEIIPVKIDDPRYEDILKQRDEERDRNETPELKTCRKPCGPCVFKCGEADDIFARPSEPAPVVDEKPEVQPGPHIKTVNPDLIPETEMIICPHTGKRVPKGQPYFCPGQLADAKGDGSKQLGLQNDEDVDPLSLILGGESQPTQNPMDTIMGGSDSLELPSLNLDIASNDGEVARPAINHMQFSFSGP